MTDDKNIKHLNSFLRGELSAVQTYDQALEKLQKDDPQIADQLRVCRESHRMRVDELTREVRRLGGEPSTESGVWGSFSKMVEGGAKMLGKKAAVSALEEGEDHGRNDYHRDIDKLDPTCRDFVRNQILPEQLKTHDAMSKLKHSI